MSSPFAKSLLLIPILILAGWCALPSIKAMTAASIISRATKEAILASPQPLQKSKIQRHFLRYGVYVPFSDIISKSSHDDFEQTLVSQHTQLCGPSRIYIWLPLKVRFPVFGYKVFEWCFKL